MKLYDSIYKSLRRVMLSAVKQHRYFMLSKISRHLGGKTYEVVGVGKAQALNNGLFEEGETVAVLFSDSGARAWLYHPGDGAGHSSVSLEILRAKKKKKKKTTPPTNKNRIVLRFYIDLSPSMHAYLPGIISMCAELMDILEAAGVTIDTPPVFAPLKQTATAFYLDEFVDIRTFSAAHPEVPRSAVPHSWLSEITLGQSALDAGATPYKEITITFTNGVYSGQDIYDMDFLYDAFNNALHASSDDATVVREQHHFVFNIGGNEARDIFVPDVIMPSFRTITWAGPFLSDTCGYNCVLAAVGPCESTPPGGIRYNNAYWYIEETRGVPISAPWDPFSSTQYQSDWPFVYRNFLLLDQWPYSTDINTWHEDNTYELFWSRTQPDRVTHYYVCANNYKDVAKAELSSATWQPDAFVDNAIAQIKAKIDNIFETHYGVASDISWTDTPETRIFGVSGKEWHQKRYTFNVWSQSLQSASWYAEGLLRLLGHLWYNDNPAPIPPL